MGAIKVTRPSNPYGLPSTHATDVNMHEVGSRVIADTATAQGNGGTTELIQGNTFNVQINGLSLHVQTPLGYAIGIGCQNGVGRRRTIARNNMEWPCSVKRIAQSV